MGDRRDTFRDFVVDQLAGIPELRCRTMFGGHGLSSGRQFFAVLYRERLYFKTSEATRAEYIAAGMDMFRPSEELALKTYFEVPIAVIEDRQKLAGWARRAIEAAGSAPSGRGRPQARSPRKRSS